MLDYSGSSDVFLMTEELSELFHEVVQNVPLNEAAFLRFLKSRGVSVFGAAQGDPGRFYDMEWLGADGEDFNGAPLFHPFRIYPVLQILRACRINVAQSASINRSRVLDLLGEVVQRLPAIDEIGLFARSANSIVNLPILLEPLYWPRISGRCAFRGFDEPHYWECLKKYRHQTLDLVARLCPDEWEEIHKILRFQAAELDENQDLYLLLRVSPWSKRERVKGNISGAMWLRHIAETIRLAFEEVYGVEWSEEDNAFGVWMKGARAQRYGSERPLDNPLLAKPHLAFEFGLHTGSVVRWYVEGETEYGAIREIIPGAADGGIEIVNLKGGLEKRRNVPLKLSDHLEQDMELKRFSVISIDGDEPDAVRFVRKQVENNKVIGFVSIHEPDFEFANFSLPELVEIAARFEESKGFPGDCLRQGDWSGVASGADFEKRYSKLSLSRSSLKGVGWGGALASYAIENPELNGVKRELMTSIDMAMRCLVTRYDYHKSGWIIDPVTFSLVEASHRL
ncbi:hypothetical protein [Halomonas sp. PBN3]|uniref:hypothetical protein n=1 Tax=Halomonas sp. PBN3 TaxID=1397528 RepID=UPI0004B7344C|nr:hypothetical protein [Halomonas sp. PBN3]